jgi:hypothetical protein
VGSLTSYNPIGLQGLLLDSFTFLLFTLLCSCTFFTYRIVSSMYSEYTVSIFRFLKLFLHDSRCFSPTVYLTALFWRAKRAFASALCPHTTIPYDREGYIKPFRSSILDSVLIINILRLILLQVLSMYFPAQIAIYYYPQEICTFNICYFPDFY